MRIYADFSRRDVNCNADDADYADLRGFFPVVMSIATRIARNMRIYADFSRRDVNCNTDYTEQRGF
jgi:hypothetical protein